MSSIKNIAFLALATGLASVANAQSTSGTGKTTRYWDCAKGSCSWPGKADVSNPVTVCGKDDAPVADYNVVSATDGGNGYMCSSQSPWAVSDSLAYGFAAVNIAGGSESSWCCACYELTFTSTAIAGKKMIVQATNTGGDLGSNQFDLAIPGGGVGIFNACSNEWGAPSAGWGAQYGGISSNTCSTLPSALQPGCEFRFGDWFQGADNPDVEWKAVTCPKAITDKTGCIRSGETPTGDSASTAAAVYSSSTAAPVASSSTAAAYSSAAPVASSSTEAAYTPPAASSSTEAAPVESSSTAPAYTAPAASSSASEAAPVASSSASSSSVAAPVESSSTASSAASSTSEYASSVATGSSSAPAATSDSPAPTGYAPGGEQCEVQYVYEE